MNSCVYIYVLKHPISNEIRYVGKTTNLKLRLQSHIDYSRSKRKQRPVSDWINSLLVNGTKPAIEQIDVCSEENWVEKERYWIAVFKSKRLLNLTEGGESNTGYRYSQELKEVRRRAREGVALKEETKEAISKSLNKMVVCEDGSMYPSLKSAVKASCVPKSTFHRKLHKKELINGKLYWYEHY